MKCPRKKLKTILQKLCYFNSNLKNPDKMKKISFLSAALLLALSACNSNKNNTADTDTLSTSTESQSNMSTSNASYEVKPGSYVNLKTGKKVYIIRDPQTGYAMDSIARVPVEFYFDPSTHDTIYETGAVVNNSLIKTSSGDWSLSEDAKMKFNGDKMKMKDGDTKIKTNGDESKVKSGDYKQKVDDNGSVKTKNGDDKTKTP
jgi:hypothetical protein